MMYAADNNLNYKRDDIEIIRNDAGKPFVYINNYTDIYISVSHSENTFACAVENSNIGLDIQFRRRVNFERLANRFYTEKEQEYVSSLGEDGFFFIWARKEAYAKFTGRGINDVVGKNDVLDRFDVEFEDSMLGENLFASVCRLKNNGDLINEC